MKRVERTAQRRRPRRGTLRRFALLALVPILLAGCHPQPLVDTKPLDTVGMSYDTIHQLKALDITTPEVAELAQAREAGLSDAGCLQAFQFYRTRKQPFTAGDTIAGLLRAGVNEELVLKLAGLNQLGLEAGELVAMRLAGLSDDILLSVAQRHAAGQPVLSGASLAGMKNLGMRSTTLLELVQRGIPDSQVASILALRRRGASDVEILRRFPGT